MAKSADCAAELSPSRKTSNGHAVKSSKQPEVPLVTSTGPLPPQYAVVCRDARKSPVAAEAPADGQEGSRSVAPPLPPVTGQRLQTADDLLENVLYAPARQTLDMSVVMKAQKPLMC